MTIKEALMRTGPTTTMMGGEKAKPSTVKSKPALTRIKGKVIWYKFHRGYGFVAGDDDASYYLPHEVAERAGDHEPMRDDRCTFIAEQRGDGKSKVITWIKFD